MIISASALVLVIIGIAVTGLVLIITRVTGGPAAPDQPLVSGEPGSPVAVSPLVCETQCFNNSSVGYMSVSQDGLDELGITDNTEPWGTFDPTTAGQLFRAAKPGWESNDGSPDECFFVPGNSPLAASLASGDPESDDAVHFIGTEDSPDKSSTLDQAVRVFADSASAEAYMAEEADQISQCDVVSIGGPAERYSAEVTPAAALEVPDAVAAIGWVRTGDPGPRWRAYVFDVQYGNLIVRTRLLTDGTNTEQQFRGLVEELAKNVVTTPPVE